MRDPSAEGGMLVRTSTALSRRLLDGILVLAPGMSLPMRVTTPGDVIWDLLAQPHTIASLVAELCDIYGVPPDTVATAIEPVLSALLEVGALTRVDSPPA